MGKIEIVRIEEDDAGNCDVELALDEDVLALLQEGAATAGVSPEEYLSQLLVEYVDRAEQEAALDELVSIAQEHTMGY